MKVYASKPLPTTNELLEILKQEFSSRYSCKLFGLGEHKSIIVRKSILTSVQISIRENEVTVQGAPSALLSIIGMTELAVVLIFFLGWLLSEPWKKLEKDLAIFLHRKYS